METDEERLTRTGQNILIAAKQRAEEEAERVARDAERDRQFRSLPWHVRKSLMVKQWYLSSGSKEGHPPIWPLFLMVIFWVGPKMLFNKIRVQVTGKRDHEYPEL